jgi:glyoxalase family protein
MTTIQTAGLHHVTAIAGDPQQNVDFYAGVLGMRLVKQTINFDDPGTYHLYYGDTEGSPSTILTFFPWRSVPNGRQGTGLATATAFSVPPESVGWWSERLRAMQVDADAPFSRGGSDVVRLRDPHGLVLELVASPGDQRSGWDGAAGIGSEHAVRGLHSVTMSEAQLEPTQRMLSDLLGMQLGEQSGDRTRFSMGDGGAGAVIDVEAGTSLPGRQAGGTVHHVAFRAPDTATQAVWRQQLLDAGVRVTEIIDRQYFTSIYFREPGGVLFEIATDDVGFAVDEPLLSLGKALKLPPWLEPNRTEIARALPVLHLPAEAGSEDAAGDRA